MRATGAGRRGGARAAAMMLLPLLLLVLTAGAGYWLGRHSVASEVAKDVAAFRVGASLGQALPASEREQAAQAFFDPDAARTAMDDFAWTVPNVPTPFVGNGPEPGQSHNAHVNALQCRSPHEIALPKPPHTYRVFVTGGSTLFGSGASSDAHTITGFLEQGLQDALAERGLHVEVFAFANPAWASTHERIAIENRIADLEPDLVASFSGLNDMQWGYVGRNVLWFRAYADEYFFRVLDAITVASGQRRLTDVAYKEPAPVAAEVVADRLERNVRLADHVLSLRDVPYVFFLQPALPLSRKPLTDRERAWLDSDKEKEVVPYWRQCAATVRSRLSALRLPGFHFVDCTGALDDAGRTEVFLDSVHFGDRGNRRCAEAMLAELLPLVRGSK